MARLELDQNNSSDSSEIYVSELIIETAKEAEKAFHKYFVESHKELKNILKKLKNDQSFQGKASDGFIEIFEILLEFHEDLIDELKPMYTLFPSLKKDLEEIKKLPFYKELS
jgi:Virulence factor EsxB.